ncbi:MAG: FAD-dependent oxidoreductase [Pseudomonadota bacterium]
MALPENTIHWSRTAVPATDFPPLRESQSAEVVVIGGGFTGLRTAIGLAEAGVDVVLLEAGDIAEGASGRSGGQCNPIWRQTPDELVGALGQNAAERLIATTLSAADDLFDDIATYSVDCDAEQHGWVQAAHTHASRDTLQRLGDGWRAVGADIEVVTGDDVAELCGSPAYGYALFHRRGGHVHPLSLSRGYATAANRLGARIHCQAGVESIERVNAKWQVRTREHRVTTERVVIATNAYTPATLWPKLHRTFLPLVSICLATAPLSEAQQASVLPGRVTLSDCRMAIYYTRYDRDNRLIFGCIGSTERPETLGGIGRLKRGLHTVFPQLSGIPIECAWGGKIAITRDMMPRLFEPAPGVTVGLGFSGRGIAMTSVMGRALAKRVLGAREDELPFPISALEPLPLHAAVATCLPLVPPVLSARDALHSARDRL